MDHQNIKPTRFSDQTEYNQVMLIRGVAQQIMTLSYPKLSAANHQLRNIGLQLVPTDALRKTSDELMTNTRGLDKELTKLGDRANNAEKAITSIRMILLANDRTDEQKVDLIKKLLTL